MTLKLSVLDQTPVPAGYSPGAALRNSIDLARHCDRLGFHRYWVAEHHNMEGLAGSSPEILVGHIAEHTERIRVGSGGVMLTHYAPLKVAENFQVLQALHPGRIDLGVGRAPGSDQRTARALARGGQQLSVEYYPTMVQELRQLLHQTVPEGGPLAGISARPYTDLAPELWLLASSQDSAAIAAHFGLPLSWAHFINPQGAPVCAAYREQFKPSAAHQRPELSIGVAVLCAETDEDADHLATSLKTWRATGRRGGIPKPGPPDPSRFIPVAPRPESPLIVGSPTTVKEKLDAVVASYDADEAVVVSICHDHDARVRSYELLADLYDLAGA